MQKLSSCLYTGSKTSRRCRTTFWAATFATFALTGVAGVLLPGCKGKEEADKVVYDERDILYRVGDSVLTVSRVVARIPEGLDKVDSAALFGNIVDEWLYGVLLEREAQLNFGDRDNIERQVQDYRRRLLIARYRESLAAVADNELLAEDSVKAAYHNRREEYRLTAPMVKGILLQLPANATRIDEIREWMANPVMANIDRIEKTVPDQVIRYEYFIDEWQDWRDIAALIPYRFPEANEYVARHPMLETSYRGTIFMLAITDHLPAGTIMPYEKAAPLIRASLLQRKQGDADRILLRNLRRKALASGALKEYRNNN